MNLNFCRSCIMCHMPSNFVFVCPDFVNQIHFEFGSECLFKWCFLSYHKDFHYDQVVLFLRKYPIVERS